MQQEMIFDLKYDETRKKYIRAKFVIDSKNTIVYFLYSIFEDFSIFGYYSHCFVYETADLMVNKKHAKFFIKEINKDKLSDIIEIKLTKIDFIIPVNIFDKVASLIDKNILKEMKEIYKDKIDESYFQENGALLISYNTIIKTIKYNNAVKKFLGVPIFAISEYRNYIDKYFPKIINNTEYKLENNNNDFILHDKFKNKTFNEAFNLCENYNDVINLSNNIVNYLNLKLLNNDESLVNNIKKKHLFLKTIMLYTFIFDSEKNIQSIINNFNEAINIYNNKIYNEFTANIISYYAKNGNDILIFYYKKTFGNKTFLKIQDIYQSLKNVVSVLECIEGADDFYKHQSEYLEEENKNKDKELQQKTIELKSLKKKIKTRKKHIGIISAVGAGLAGGLTATAILLSKLKIKK